MRATVEVVAAVVATCLALLLTAGCSGGKGDSPSATAPATTVAPEGHAEIASIDHVLAGLDGVMGDLQRILVRDRRITTEVTDRLRSIYAGPELLNQIDAFRADVANGLTGYRPTPGNRVTTVSRLITLSPVCVFAEVTRDYSPVSVNAGPSPARLYVVLVNKDESEDPKHLNPTPWTMLYDGVQEGGGQPDDICRARA